MPADSQQMQVEREGNGRFVKGRSGNPSGRAAGTRNRATVLAEQLFDGATAALANKAVAMALDGDAAALRLCIGRIIAPGAIECVAQPPKALTTSPCFRPSERDCSTMPMAPPRMVSPISTGGMYWSWSLIQMRLVGSSDR